MSQKPSRHRGRTSPIGKIIKVSAGVFLALILLAVISFLALRNVLADAAFSAVDRAIPGSLIAEDIELVIIRSFPRVELRIRGADLRDPSGGPVLSAGDLIAAISLPSLFRREVNVPRVSLRSGGASIAVAENGDINLLLALGASGGDESASEPDGEDLPKPEEAEGNEPGIRIGEVSIEDLTVLLTGPEHRLGLRIERLAFGGMRDAQASEGDLSVELDEISSDLIPSWWSDGKGLSMNVSLEFDRRRRIISLADAAISLDNAIFQASGTVAADAPYEADIRFSSDLREIGELGALLPALLDTNEAATLVAGSMDLRGAVSGPLSGQIPVFALQAGASGVIIEHRDSGSRLEDFAFDLSLSHDGSIPRLDLENLYGRLPNGSFAFDASVSGRQVVSLDIRGTTDVRLDELSRFVSFPGSEDIRGNLSLDLEIQGEFEGTGRVLTRRTENGNVELRNVTWSLPDTPYRIDDMDLVFSLDDGFLGITRLSGTSRVGTINARGGIRDIWPFVFGTDEPVEIDFQVSSPLIETANWFEDDPLLQETWNYRFADVDLQTSFALDSTEIRRGNYLSSSSFSIREFSFRELNRGDVLHSLAGELAYHPSALGMLARIRFNDSDMSMTAGIENVGALIDSQRDEEVALSLTLSSELIRGTDIIPEGLVPQDSYLMGDLTGFALEAGMRFTNQAFFARRGPIPEGSFELTQVRGRFLDYPAEIRSIELAIRLEDDAVILDRFAGAIGSSEFELSGDLSPASGLFAEDKTVLEGNLQLRASTLNLNELLDLEEAGDPAAQSGRDAAAGSAGAEAAAIPNSLPKLAIRAEVSNLNIDRLFFDRVTGHLQTDRNGVIRLQDTGFRLGDGSFDASGRIDLGDSERIGLSGSLVCRAIDLAELAIPIESADGRFYLSDHIRGRFSGEVDLRAVLGRDLAVDASTVRGNIGLRLENGELIEIAPLEAMAEYFNNRNFSRVRFADLTTDIAISDGGLRVPRTGIGSTLGYLEIEGSMNNEPFMSFQVSVPTRLVLGAAWNALFSREKEQHDEEEEVFTEENSGVLMSHVNVVGRPEDFMIGLGKNRREQLEARYERRRSSE